MEIVIDTSILVGRLNDNDLWHTQAIAIQDVPRLYQDALHLMQTSNGELNFNDALIALACRERGITLIASFDPDFDRVPWLKRVVEPTDVEAAHT